MDFPLLTTKLVIPPPAHSLVARPRLLAALDEIPQWPLALVCAPAGYGKTTLLAEWLAQRAGRLQAGWISLDEGDNDPAQFLAYLNAALNGGKADASSTAAVSPTAERMLQALPLPPVQAILTTLINDLHRSGTPLVVVLDDYQFISNNAIHEGLAFLLDRLPPNVHVVVATRSDPPLPLARFRVRGRLLEIRADDLRFSLEEATELLTQVIGPALGVQEVKRLEQRTEGWAAGLQMAALALKSVSQTRPGGVAAYVAGFSGTNRYILDYLAEEVLCCQSENIQAFLLQTSILDRLCGPLCDAVMAGTENTGDPPLPAGRQVLEMLERANLFLMPLDAERRWYRYHHLFADLLRTRLEQQYPQRRSELYIRASRWYEGQGMLADAIAVALAGPDPAHTADLLERVILTVFYYCEIARVHRWLEALPKTLLLQRPLLCAVYAAATSLLPPYFPQSLPAAEKWMQAAEAGLASGVSSACLARAFIANIRAYWARFRDEAPDRVIEASRLALALIPPNPDPALERDWQRLRSAVETNLALAHFDAGDEAEAQQAFIRARAINEACGDWFNASQAFISLAAISFRHGQLREAAAMCREGQEFFSRRAAQLGHPVAYAGEIGVQLAEVMVEQNEFAEAEKLLKESTELAQWTMGRNILMRGYLALARLEAARGNPDAAFDYLSKVQEIGKSGESLGGAQRAALWLALSDRQPQYAELARAWGEEQTLMEFCEGRPMAAWTVSLALAQARLADEAPNAASRPALLDWLVAQKRAMHARGWAHWEIQLGIVESLARWAAGDKPGSLAALRHTLELAEPGGYTLVFVEQGEPMRTLLHAYVQTGSPSHKAYARQLLAAFGGASQPPSPVEPASQLAEPLSARELEILRLLAEGASNRQIAGKLILAEGTVKFYVHSLLQKLGVQNRSQAVAEARRHKLI